MFKYVYTQEPGRFLPAESCVLVVHSLQVSSCTAEHHGPLGFPGLEMDKTCLVPEKTPSYIFYSLTKCCSHLIQLNPYRQYLFFFCTHPSVKKCYNKLYGGIKQLLQGEAEGFLKEN